jgi:molecular chaperone GrpE
VAISLRKIDHQKNMKMSEEKELNEEQSIPVTESETVTDESTVTEETVVEEAAELSWEDKYEEMNDKFVRLYAEFDNYRRRTNKERIDLIGSASAGVVKDMIPVLDDFDRALANNEKSEDLNAVKEGFILVSTKFRNILEGKGLKPMKSKGEPFDSEFHEAIANIPAPDKKLKGKVVDDVEKGYLLNDKVIRFAKVVVGQ